MAVERADLLAERLLSGLEPRWSHVRGVVEVARRLTKATPGLDPAVVEAAWLHDIGYAATLSRTGCHPLDGAAYLAANGFSAQVVRLVAFHTGAEFEARERGLGQLLEGFPRPEQRELDALTLADLSVSPQGLRVHPAERIAEILDRYASTDSVHRAVGRSKDYLMDCAARAAAETGSPEEWGFPPA